MGERMVRKQMYFEPEQAEALRRLAHKKKISEAEIVREALAEYLKKEDVVGENPLLELCGCYEGESDESTNHDRYIYGQK